VISKSYSFAVALSNPQMKIEVFELCTPSKQNAPPIFLKKSKFEFLSISTPQHRKKARFGVLF